MAPALAGDLTRPLGVKAHDSAQQDGLRLVTRQGRDKGEGLLRGDGLDGALCPVLAASDEGEILDRNWHGRRMAAGTAQVVRGPVLGKGGRLGISSSWDQWHD